MLAIRPRRLLPPLLFGLGVQLQHQFASRFLIDTLYRLGFSIHYADVMQFQASAAASTGIDIGRLPGQFLQFSADNVDHDTITLDGTGTFHGMGMVCTLTPAAANDKATKPVPRLTTIPSDVLKHLSRVNLQIWNGEFNLKSMRYDGKSLSNAYPSSDLDLLWRFSWPSRPTRPKWSGFMQMVYKLNVPTQAKKASIMFCR